MLKDFMETWEYKVADVIILIDKNGQEIEDKDIEDILNVEVIDFNSKGFNGGFLEIQLDVE